MNIPVLENENQLRQRIRAAWAKPFSIEHALIIKTTDRYQTVVSLRTLATELGARAIILDLDESLTPEQADLLRRPGPRVVVISGIETLSEVGKKGLPNAINSGGRALPIFLWLEESAETTPTDTPAEADA